MFAEVGVDALPHVVVADAGDDLLRQVERQRGNGQRRRRKHGQLVPGELAESRGADAQALPEERFGDALGRGVVARWFGVRGGLAAGGFPLVSGAVPRGVRRLGEALAECRDDEGAVFAVDEEEKAEEGPVAGLAPEELLVGDEDAHELAQAVGTASLARLRADVAGDAPQVRPEHARELGVVALAGDGLLEGDDGGGVFTGFHEGGRQDRPAARIERLVEVVVEHASEEEGEEALHRGRLVRDVHPDVQDAPEHTLEGEFAQDLRAAGVRGGVRHGGDGGHEQALGGIPAPLLPLVPGDVLHDGEVADVGAVPFGECDAVVLGEGRQVARERRAVLQHGLAELQREPVEDLFRRGRGEHPEIESVVRLAEHVDAAQERGEVAFAAQGPGHFVRERRAKGDMEEIEVPLVVGEDALQPDATGPELGLAAAQPGEHPPAAAAEGVEVELGPGELLLEGEGRRQRRGAQPPDGGV